MEDIVRAFNITHKDEAIHTVNLKAGERLFHANVKSGQSTYSIGLKDPNGIWHNIDLSDQIVQGEWHDVEKVIETDYDITEISLLNNVGTAQVLLPMLETGTKKSAKRPHVLDIEESAIVQSASWEIHTSSPVIYKDAQDAQTEGSHTPVTITGRHWVGSVMTEEGFITATADGDTEGTPVASPLILNAENGKSMYTLRLYSDINKTELLDYETIPIVFKGAEGVNAIQIHIDNPIDAIPADKDGNALTLAGTGTNIHAFEGSVELEYDSIGDSNGKFKVTASPTNITMGAITDIEGVCNVSDATAMPANENKATIVYTITGKTLKGLSFSVTGEQNFSKTKMGADGQIGEDGKGVDSVTIWYYKSTSETQLEGGIWSAAKPVYEESTFLWTKVVTTYTDNTEVETTPVLDPDWHTTNAAAIEAKAKADALEYLKQAIGQDAVVNGALYTLATILLKEDMSADVTAGVSGLQGVDKNLPAFWAGGTDVQAQQGTAKAIIKHDGGGHLASGNIEWDTDGNVQQRGKYESSASGNRIVIDPATGKVYMYSAENYITGEMVHETENMGGVQLSRARVVLRELSSTEDELWRLLDLSPRAITFDSYNIGTGSVNTRLSIEPNIIRIIHGANEMVRISIEPSDGTARIKFSDLPVSSTAQTGELYKDENGFVKIK